MARKKQLRLDEVYSLPNVLKHENNTTTKNISKYFGNNNPITLEVGCGHGDYSINLAQKLKERNFIGLDVRATRVFVGAKEALSSNINNVAFLVARADQLPEIFTKQKVQEIWIPFPDSLPRRRDSFKRLCSTNFIEVYKKIIDKNGIIHLKTDDGPLYNFANENLDRPDIKIIKSTENLHIESNLTYEEQIKTLHEKVFIREGRTIKYISFKFL